MTRTEFIALVRTYTQDAKSYLDDAWPGTPDVLDRDELIAKLIDLYNAEVSRFAKRQKIADVSGTDTSLYRLSTALTSWLDDFSAISRVIYPYSATDENPTPLDSDSDYKVEKRLWIADTADTLVFITSTPATGETFRVTYNILHDFTVTLTLDDKDVPFYAYFLAGQYLEIVAAEWLQHIDGTNTADIVAAGGISPIADVKALARNFISNFYSHFGADPKTQTVNASGWQQWDMSKDPRNYWYHK